MAETGEPTQEQAPLCPPCRGTGRIVSRLGGSPSTIVCPWCEGTGHVLAGHDAQRRATATGGEDDEGPAAA